MNNNGVPYRVDLLLSCTCIVIEPIESVVFAPYPGELRVCGKHQREVVISEVGRPYQKREEKEIEKEERG